MRLLEVQAAFLLDREQRPVLVVDAGVLALAHRMEERRDLARCAVGENPVLPLVGLQREAAAQLDRVDAEPVEHLRLDDRQLLHEVVHVDVAGLDAKTLLEFVVGDRHDP
jgi:hypothetical protein